MQKILVFIFAFWLTACGSDEQQDAVVPDKQPKGVAWLAPKSIKIDDILSWYHADIGMMEVPDGVDKLLIEESNGKGYLYDGVVKGWTETFFDNGRKKRKLFFAPDHPSADEKGRVRGMSFDYFYLEGDTYAKFGDGERYPVYWLKNGKPINGFVKVGKEDRTEGALQGDRLVPVEDEDAWLMYYVKNGLANGISRYKLSRWSKTLETRKGNYRNGFKHAAFSETKNILGLFHITKNYDMGTLHGSHITKFNGREIEKLNYHQGKLHGVNYANWDDGSPRIIATMDHGDLVKGTIFYDDGSKEELTEMNLEQAGGLGKF